MLGYIRFKGPGYTLYVVAEVDIPNNWKRKTSCYIDIRLGFGQSQV